MKFSGFQSPLGFAENKFDESLLFHFLRS